MNDSQKTIFKKIFKKVGFALLIIFAAIGFFLTAGYIAIRLGLTNTQGVIDNQRQAFLNGSLSGTASLSWQNTAEWATLRAAIVKDQPIINRAAADAGVPARLIVENLIGEQLRFFFDDRESYKKFFAPLKILGSETQFSWGVMGVKENTAVQIEQNLYATSSPFYLGPAYTHLLDFKTADVSQERFTRMTDQHDHYWSYVYAGLYIHQIENQWRTAGFDISGALSTTGVSTPIRPDIIATLYNVGFANSRPNANPQSGGAVIPVAGQQWSFGSLAASFYNSDELINEFPR